MPSRLKNVTIYDIQKTLFFFDLTRVKNTRSTIRIAAVPTAIEYEYRFTEYDYEYDEIRGDTVFVLLLVLVLSLPRRTVLVLEAIL